MMRYRVPFRLPSKALMIVALILACLAMTSVIACQFHVGPSPHDSAQPSEHHKRSTTHTTVDTACLIAVLSSVMPLLVFLSVFLFAMPLLRKYDASVLLPFIPPRHAYVSLF